MKQFFIDLSLWTPVAFTIVVLFVSWLIVFSRRATRLHANFPPGIPIVGEFLTVAYTGLTGPLTSRTAYTAPVSGLYLVAQCTNVASSDGTGSIQTTLTAPHTTAIAVALAPLEADPTLSGTPSAIKDGYSGMIPVWMNVGDTLKIAAANASGLTGTTYNVYVVIGRVL